MLVFHQSFEGLALETRVAILQGSLLRKNLLAGAFSVTTPAGMAIGIGTLSSFNGNDPSTVIAIGELNTFGAGIVLWIGVTEMWYKEWWNGPLRHAGLLIISVAFAGLVGGMVIMSVLGKWA